MQLRLNKGEMELRFFEDVANETLSLLILKKGQRLADGTWHQINLIYGLDDVSLAVDYRRPVYVTLSQIEAPSLIFEPDSEIVIGAGAFDSQPGEGYYH